MDENGQKPTTRPGVCGTPMAQPVTVEIFKTAYALVLGVAHLRQ